MNRTFLAFVASAVIVAFSVAAGQTSAPDFTGKWKLDVLKSDLGEPAKIESMEMNVEQTVETFSVERITKMSDGSAGRGTMGGGKLVYRLGGKETRTADPTGSEIALWAEIGNDGELVLKQTRHIDTQMGSITLKTVESWELKDNGRTLVVAFSTEVPPGTRIQKLVFNKQ